MTDKSAGGTSHYRHRPRWWALIIAAPGIIGLTFCTYAWYTDRAVAMREQSTSGTIVVHEPANHSRYGYTFNLNEKTYTGWQVPYNSEQFALGQVVTVHYDPLDPNNSSLVDYYQLSSRALGPAPFLVGVLAVALFAFVRRRAVPQSARPTPG